MHHIDLGENAVFAAPEQLLSGGRDCEDGRLQKWDVYSFGLLAYWLIHDRLPRVNGFSAVQSLQLAEGYLELGELFAERGATAEELDQLHDETVRLLIPL